MLKRTCSGLMIIILSISIMGCWDRIELEDRGFVIGVAIDNAEEEEEQQSEQDEKSDKPVGKQRFRGTFQLVIPGALSGEKGGMSVKKGENASEASFNISSVGDTMDTITTGLSTTTSRIPYFDHLQVIVVSEDVARSEYGFANVMDYFLRNRELRLNIIILVAKGEARKILDVRPPNEKLPAMYIRSIAKHSEKTASMPPESRIGDLAEHLLRSESFAIQSVEGQKQKVEIAGSAVFQGGKNNLIGFLDREETEGLNYITGEVKLGVVKFKMEDNLAVFDITNMKRRIKAVVDKNNKIKFKITVESRGILGELYDRPNFLNPKVEKKAERKVAKEIERLMQETINKVQKEYKKDVLGLGQYLKENHYDTWKQVRDNWDTGENYFAQSSIELEAKVEIHRIGINNKTEKRKE